MFMLCDERGTAVRDLHVLKQLVVVQVVHENFGIVEGLMTTVHAATATQKTGVCCLCRRSNCIVTVDSAYSYF